MALKPSLNTALNKANETSDTIDLAGYFNFSLSGSWVGTVKIERSFDNGSSWLAVDSFTANTESVGHEPEGARYRIRCSAYTSGLIIGRLGQ